MNAGKKRKLIQLKVLSTLAFWVDLGVPIAKAINDAGINKHISRPAAAKLINIYLQMNRLPSGSSEAIAILHSLQPEWLDSKIDKAVQEQPSGWNYEGFFPLGEWRKEE